MISRTVLVALLLQAAAPQATPQTAAASIDGVVVRVGTQEPIDGAQVLLAKVATPEESGRTVPSFSVTTADDGRFAFKNIRAGTYRLMFAANGYIRQEYGQRIFPGPGISINFTADLTMKNVVVAMTPAGSVSGRIQDASRKPLAGVPVQLTRYAYDYEGKRSLQAFAGGQTNDHGEFRLFFVTPGRYYLSAGSSQVPNEYDTPEPVEGAIREFYNYIFYPGVVEPERATVIDVQPGSDIRGMDLTIERQQPVRVRGRVVDAATGQPPPRAIVQLTYREPGTGRDYYVSRRAEGTYSNGSFEFQAVLPGFYSIAALVGEPPPPNSFTTERPNALQPFRAGYVLINIATSDVEGLLITIPAGKISISGRQTVENGGRAPTSLSPFIRLRPSLNGGPPAIPGLVEPNYSGAAPDGRFQMTNVPPGEYTLEIGPPSGFYTKEVRFGGADVLNRPMQFTGSESSMLDIVFSPGVGTIEGKVVGDRLEPLPSAQVVLVPDRYRDRPELFKNAFTDENGRFSISNIVPGDYKLFAWEAMEPYAYFDPNILRRSEPNATGVHVGELSRQSVDLKAMPMP